ncbi:virulence factor TspB C-terminal domain-related protein [Acinetobacter baumannii]|nr:virulence factor TspB C-terminal domain-related protein [Acinetobacter baumannii]
MHFLRYLIFIIISLFSVQAFAVTWQANVNGLLKTGSTPDSVCSQAQSYISSSYPNQNTTYSHTLTKRNDQLYLCLVYAANNHAGPWDFNVYTNDTVPPVTCPSQGTPVPTYFEPNTPIPLRVCKSNPDGTYCIFDAPDKNNPIVISSGQYQNITLRSISSIPSPSCTPEFSKDTCNPNDPYGGCYKPPNDNCNRMADGSIYCPPDEQPPIIKSGCQNGATYCDMPPTGCGTGYVPGTFNGKQICVKNSNPPPTDPPDQPPPASDPPPVDPPDPGDPPPPPPPPPPSSNDPLLRAILDAINAVNNKLTWLKNELVNSLNYIAKKIDVTNSKLDTTNQKLDTVNSSIKETTAAVNASGDKIKAAVDANATTVKTAVEANTAATNGVKTAVEANTNSTANKLNEVVNAINNKPVGGGGSATNMGPTNDLLTEIKNFLTGGNLPEDKGEKIETKELNSQTFNTGLITTGGSVCPEDYPINWSTPFGTINKSISFVNLCAQSSWIGYLVLAFAYMIAAGIVVRA